MGNGVALGTCIAKRGPKADEIYQMRTFPYNYFSVFHVKTNVILNWFEWKVLCQFPYYARLNNADDIYKLFSI